MDSKKKISKRINVKGLVQGVGFRPFIYRLANQHKLKGWVENRNDGVIIEVFGLADDVRSFILAIKNEAPVASNIIKIVSSEIDYKEFADFQIVKSENTSDAITDISPDIAICNNCLTDLKEQQHRIQYPFTNCTNCGPRFSIIKDLPYDRDKTTMASFEMCPICSAEYKDVLNRRFHAQPVACNNCGPVYTLLYGKTEINDFGEILKASRKLLLAGKIIGIKGIGGFQIACDAQNDEAVNRLRKRKNREGKPFAVMFSNIEKLKEFTFLNDTEEKVITSWRRPIVLLKEKKKLASGVSVGFNTVGAMLPYMPFHFQLFDEFNIPAIVLTSGNISDEPIAIDNAKAIDELTKICDAIILCNRDIYNRTDDSVATIINNRERLIRRSRGYSPEPVNLKLNVDGIFATGAELVNSFCIGKGNQAILSQHIGDLKNLETLEFYEESFLRFKKLFRAEPRLVVHDLHPDYLSTRFAKQLGLETMAVQHHHAHIASCMAEFNLDDEVIGVSFDGTGLGDDGNIWGGEFLICDLKDYKRYNHFEYIPLPGGDSVTKEPWRTALSMLYKVYGMELFDLDIPFVSDLDRPKAEMMIQLINKDLNSPLSSSAGRLFDAVSALLNICTQTKFHAEAPMRLEDVIQYGQKGAYPFDFGNVISFQDTISHIVEDIREGISTAEISAKFHNTVVNVVFAVSNMIRKQKGINRVVLSGGTFQNKYLLSQVETLLTLDGFKVYSQSKVPSNDGGVSLGQLVIAAKRRSLANKD